ncbi:methionyl-tRNA formyltransferase [uncultured Thomasclavelia sp.]|uniref:methionyl-tRNA formyltransferase n=1 Tax=uncultured Thomasclavelia sp. TaxID=3025759 RepID=UPI0025E8044A|nr:methionyl-tRNA formyltransferase [uncultured Thomasclavelia sp.]
MENTRIVFMGTASFSKQVLVKLLEEKYNIIGVVTQPDRLVGRKKVLTMPEVKEVALKYQIPVLQPARIKEDYQEIIDLKPDLIITAAYGQIVPDAILQAPKLGCINVHASLLPKYRGGAPVHYAIINGEEKTGVTIMYMVKKMDAGNIISQVEVAIDEQENMGDLYQRLSVVGADLLLETLPAIINQTNNSIVQDESLVTYAPVITHEQEKIDFNQSAKDVYNRVRGLNPWPGAYTTYEGKNVKIWAGMIHNCANAKVHHQHQPNGTIVKIFKDAIGVKTGDGIYLITELQLAGKKRMAVKDYLNGNNIFKVDTQFE